MKIIKYLFLIYYFCFTGLSISQSNKYVGFGYSRVSLIEEFNHDWQLTSFKYKKALNNYHLDFSIQPIKNKFIFNTSLIYFKDEINRADFMDGRFPFSNYTSPREADERTIYNLNTFSISFSLAYLNKKRVSSYFDFAIGFLNQFNSTYKIEQDYLYYHNVVGIGQVNDSIVTIEVEEGNHNQIFSQGSIHSSFGLSAKLKNYILLILKGSFGYKFSIYFNSPSPGWMYSLQISILMNLKKPVSNE